MDIATAVNTITKRGGNEEPFSAVKLTMSARSALKASGVDDTSVDFDELVRVGATLDNSAALAKVTEAWLGTLAPQAAAAYHEFRKQSIAKRNRDKNLDVALGKLLSKDRTVVNENANKDSNVFNTQRDLTAGTIARATGLKMLPPAVANAHIKGDIHWHDLDYQPYSPMTNCCLIDFEGMLKHGFKIGNATMGTPHSIQTAVVQMTQIIASVASSQYGGCSADSTDEFLAPYAMRNYDKHLQEAEEWIDDPATREKYARSKTKADIAQAMESLEYQINTLYSSQGQTPFTTVGFGLGTSWAAVEIQKAILNTRIKGLGTERRTAIFPKLVFTLKRGLNLEPGDPNYAIKELALDCATKRMYPDVLNYDKIVALTGSFKAPMGCRSFLQGWRDASGAEVNAGRMNLGVVTVNLPRIALESGGNKAQFWALLESRLDVCHEALAFKLNRAKQASPKNAPTLYMYGAFGKRLGEDDNVDDLFKNGRATISLGYIGLYEVGTVFYGPDWEHNQEAKDFSVSVVKALYDHCKQWEAAEGYHYSVYSTPSESLTDRFCRLDTEKFGTIPNITDKEYYTNSFHYDVRKSPTPFEKIDFEKDYPKYCSGGFIHYCEYPNLRQNPKALEAVWDYAYDRIGYLGTNTPIDQCFKCGFKGEFTATARGFKCPDCGNTDPATCDVVKRTCGYLGNPNQRPMVHGRHMEIMARRKHMTFGNDQIAGGK
ncbi:anaerobic ribonucleoside-triphosphate reductase [Lacticaseibacillus pabuli]|uniref:Anaerobic ribonucleoside-triphosphate reductase n=1 Tax=Lacticaseibacillus pabuli TaxID=3025672 RepID=A0ABY7WPM1_9LACO|nr:anaerobic ribonucleoside-triphosphate reductase [Lacticaseibacillus sp. KACC 23028]WDF81739.1 anaerobic ribonucleoside-triphosphate reductase [Lacticaseibacillus sp. KACC 23028]